MDLFAQTAFDWTFIDGVVSRYGIGGAGLAVAAYFVWRVGKFFAPIVQKISESHIDLVGTLKTNTETQTEVLTKLTECGEQRHAAMYCESRALEELANDDKQRASVRMHAEQMRRKLDGDR